MTEQNYVYVDANYLKELEEKAKKVDYYKGVMDGIMVCTQTYDDKYWLSLLQAVADGEMSDAGANQAWLEYINRKDEPQTCEECEHWNDTEDGCADRHNCKTEPQTDCPWK